MIDNQLTLFSASPTKPITIKTDLKKAAIKFLQQLQAQEVTRRAHYHHLKQFFYFLWINHIDYPTEENLIDYKFWVEEKKFKYGYSNRFLITLKMFFSWLDDNDLYKNIAKKVKLFKDDKFYKKDPLSLDQAKELLASVDKNTLMGKRDYAIVSLMLSCGLRRIEISRANIGDIKKSPIGENLLFVQGKGCLEKNNFVKLPPHVFQALKEYIDTRDNKSPQEPLFHILCRNSIPRRIKPCGVSKIVNKYLQKIGVKENSRITPHSLRHTTAILNLQNGGTLEETQQLLRHKNIGDTMIYAFHLKKLENKSEERIDNILFN